MPNPPLTKLISQLAYQFSDISLLELALRHSSIGAKNNERLEYLGDAILNLVIAQALFERFPKEKEGKLSRMRAQLVKGDTLAEIAKELKLGDFLQMGAGELKSGGFRRDSILADAVEAIIGAVSQDSDWFSAQTLILHLYATRLQQINANDVNVKDAKTRLQEYQQAKKKALPVYEVVSIDGQDHQQQFDVSCRVEQLPNAINAKGESRKIAEQRVAKACLVALGVDKK